MNFVSKNGAGKLNDLPVDPSRICLYCIMVARNVPRPNARGHFVQVSGIDRARAFAQDCFNRGNLAAAEVVCRDILSASPADAVALHLLGVIAARIGMRDHAQRYLSEALSADPGRSAARDALAALSGGLPPAPAAQQRPPSPKYLVIKSWGFGFWSDVSQVLGALLLAECTSRIPVVHWGSNSLFGDGSGRDAFLHYFEPVSDVTLQDVAKIPGVGCFPPKWSCQNLFDENLNKWQGSYSRAAAIYFLARQETIAICDFYIGVIDVAPWLMPDHPMYGKPLIAVYRYLINKYLRPRQSFLVEREAFFRTHLAVSPFVALHIRGSDKSGEQAELDVINQANRAALATVDSSWKIFLLTDDENWLARIKKAYGDRVVATDSHRTAGATGVHYLNVADNRIRLGYEVMMDVYLATRADKFFGNGQSNVAAFVEMLKDWGAGNCVLRAPSLLMTRNLFIHLVPRR